MTTANRPYSPHNLHSLESLVPPLELCRKIPSGEFEDSALVWERNIGLDRTEYAPFVNTRNDALTYNVIAPAPTLQEILAEIPDVTVNYDGRGRWAVQAILPSTAYGDCNANPATAALKLWLELIGAK